MSEDNTNQSQQEPASKSQNHKWPGNLQIYKSFVTYKHKVQPCLDHAIALKMVLTTWLLELT